MSRGYYRKRSEAVLIDTWWNVNDKRKQPGYWLGKVLIDTWWNVNNTDIYPVGSYACFNRYMVECEFCDIPAVDGCRTGFNRYMVECECKWKRLYPGI